MAEPAANTLDQVAGKGATDTQPSSEDGVVFVEQEHKKHSDAPPTPLQANPQTARPKH
jgi:hypothetical protein